MSTALDLSDSATFFDDNIVVAEVDNLLCGWLTYMIDLTLQRPGPLKLILRLKDASPFKQLEDMDSDDESESPAKSLCDSPTLTKDSDVTMVDNHDMIDISERFSANPVVLHGIIKDSPAISALRKKFAAEDHGYVWPPPRSFKQISPNVPTTSIDRIKVLPADVAALKIN